jgi:predicted glycosyl hydrolase (DUF1957 family)
MSNSSDKLNVAFVLHAYQPPNQDPEVLARIVKNCYLPIALLLENNSSFKITLNFNASLSEMLAEEYNLVIEKYASLARNGQIEFLESGAYHPILPLFSEKEAKYQIRMNHQINLEIFGSVWNPSGFWPPELAVSNETIKLLENMGYRYSMVPEIALITNPTFPQPLTNFIPTVPFASNLALISRNREISNNISFRRYSSINNVKEHFGQLKKKSKTNSSTLIIASDIETFGEHHKNYEKFLAEILEISNSQTITDILSYPYKQIEEFRNSSWSTSEEDIYRNIPYPLWAYPGNSIHEILNFHSDLLSESLDFLLTQKEETDFEVRKALKKVAKAQYSCQTWWASTKDHFSKKLILDGFEAQQEALKATIQAIGTEYPHSVIQSTSERLKKRLNLYLQRIT